MITIRELAYGREKKNGPWRLLGGSGDSSECVSESLGVRFSWTGSKLLRC